MTLLFLFTITEVSTKGVLGWFFWISCMTTISITSEHVAAINSFCLSLWIRSKQPVGQEKLPGLMLGIQAEIWFKCRLIVFCLLTFPKLHCVLLLQKKIVTKIKLSGKVLLLFQCQSHRTYGNAVPEGNQSRSVRCFSSYAGKTLWKKMSCSPSVNHPKNRLLGFIFSPLFYSSLLRECWFCNCAIRNNRERWDWTGQFVHAVGDLTQTWPERCLSEKGMETL